MNSGIKVWVIRSLWDQERQWMRANSQGLMCCTLLAGPWKNRGSLPLGLRSQETSTHCSLGSCGFGMMGHNALCFLWGLYTLVPCCGNVQCRKCTWHFLPQSPCVSTLPITGHSFDKVTVMSSAMAAITLPKRNLTVVSPLSWVSWPTRLGLSTPNQNSPGWTLSIVPALCCGSTRVWTNKCVQRSALGISVGNYREQGLGIQ